jgi:hypothetical protein
VYHAPLDELRSISPVFADYVKRLLDDMIYWSHSGILRDVLHPAYYNPYFRRFEEDYQRSIPQTMNYEHYEMPAPRNRRSRIDHYEKIYNNLHMPNVEKIKHLAKHWLNIDLSSPTNNSKRHIKIRWLRYLSPQKYEYTNNHNAYAKRYVLFTESQKLIQ